MKFHYCYQLLLFAEVTVINITYSISKFFFLGRKYLENPCLIL